MKQHLIEQQWFGFRGLLHIGIKNKFGKNAILKGINFQEGATAKDRNEQIGGHKA